MSIINKQSKKNNSQIRGSLINENNYPSSIISVLQNKISILCDLCNHQAIHPKLCPVCNEIFCEKCLNNYHNQYKNCPMCHQKLLINQFLNFQYNSILDLFKRKLHQFNFNQHQQDRKLQFYQVTHKQLQQEQQKCLQHSVPMKYFCQNCSKPICSDCGMMSNQHKNHTFSRLNDIYTKIKQKLNNQLGLLTKKIFQTQEHSLKIKKKLQKLEIQHMHIKRYTQEYYILLIQKFQDEISTKTICLKQIQQKNTKQIEFYESCRDNICEQIQRKSKNQLIQQADKLSTSFAMVICQPPEELQIQDTFQTIKQLLPDYNNFEYCLHNFSLSNGGIVYSESYQLNGVEWRLKIYPKGNGVAKGKYLSVFVQMTKAQSNQKKYEYKIQLINHFNSVQHIRRQYCSAFDIGQCWGYNQFISLEQLQNGFLNDDKLHFIMGIRNPDYRSLSFDQSTYIAKLQSQLRKKQLQRQNYIQQTNIIEDIQNKSYSSKNSNSINNQTKFLKFLQNSSSFQERKNERKQKQREREMQRGQKDQQYLTMELLNQLNQEYKEKIQNRRQRIEGQLDRFIQPKSQIKFKNQHNHKQFDRINQDLQTQQKFQFRQKAKKQNKGSIKVNNKVSWRQNLININERERQKQDKHEKRQQRSKQQNFRTKQKQQIKRDFIELKRDSKPRQQIKVQSEAKDINFDINLQSNNRRSAILNMSQRHLVEQKQSYNYEPKLKNQNRTGFQKTEIRNTKKQQKLQKNTLQLERKSLQQQKRLIKSQKQQKSKYQKQQKTQKQLKHDQTNKNEQKYKFYFSNSNKRHINLDTNDIKNMKQTKQIKQLKKYQEKYHQQTKSSFQFFRQDQYYSKQQVIKKSTIQNKKKKKIQEDKRKIQQKQKIDLDDEQQKWVQKFQSKKLSAIKNKQITKGSPSKFKTTNHQDTYKQRQISNILQQSKKLQGIDNKSNHLKSNSSSIKQINQANSFTKTSSKIGYLKIQKKEQQDKNQ